MSNHLWIDCETSGLGDNAAVIELAAIAMIDGEVKHHFQSYVRPHEKATLDPKAFEINKIDIKKIWEFPDAEKVIDDFINYVDSFECVFSLAGHNISFDRKMLYKLFCRNARYGDYINRFRPGELCTFKAAKEVFKGKKNKPDGFSLGKLCDFYKIHITEAHSALPDIQATIELYNFLQPSIANISDNKIKILPYKDMKIKYMMDRKYIQINPEGDIFITKDAINSDIIRRFIFTELDNLYEESMHNL